MKSRIRTHKKRTKEQTQEFSTAPAQGMFQSRPFEVQSKVGEQSIQQKSDLKTQLSRATRFGHNLKKIKAEESKAAQVQEKPAVQRRVEEEQPVGGLTKNAIQRALIKNDEAYTAYDTDHPEVQLSMWDDEPNKFSIDNEGSYGGKQIIYNPEDGKYYLPQKGGSEPDLSQEFKLSKVMAGKRASDNRAEISVGEEGTGVKGGGKCKIKTSGLITCVAWVLYNESAAYMCHIVCTDPPLVKQEKVKEQVAARVAKFKEEVGTMPTGVEIAYPAQNPAYKKQEGRDWLKALEPAGLAARMCEAGGTWEYTVQGGEGERKEWKDAAIRLEYASVGEKKEKKKETAGESPQEERKQNRRDTSGPFWHQRR